MVTFSGFFTHLPNGKNQMAVLGVRQTFAAVNGINGRRTRSKGVCKMYDKISINCFWCSAMVQCYEAWAWAFQPSKFIKKRKKIVGNEMKKRMEYRKKSFYDRWRASKTHLYTIIPWVTDIFDLAIVWAKNGYFVFTLVTHSTAVHRLWILTRLK